MNENQHQQQMMNMNMNMNQNPQKMMSMNQHQPQQQMMLSQPPPSMAPSQPMMNRSYGMWGPPLPAPSMDQLKFQNPKGFVPGKVQQQQQLGPRSNWKGKKVNDKRKDGRRKDNIGMSLMAGSSSSGVGGISGGSTGSGGYIPPMLHELQHQNRVKARRFFTKKKFNPYYHNNNSGGYNMGKFAPRNTSSFIIRAKKSGGITELVSPAQVTPAVLPTPIFSPSREVLVDMAKEEWGVDGYGSMKGLIRLRSPGREDEVHDVDEEEEEGGSSESDVEEHVEVERRLDHDLSRFEMIYPNHGGGTGMDYNNVLENRVDDQDTHIAQLEEENLILKERLFLMERELGDLRRRLHCLERQRHGGGGEDTNEEVVENGSENDSESRGEAHSMEDDNNEEFIGENMGVYGDVGRKKGENKEIDCEVLKDVGGKEDKDIIKGIDGHPESNNNNEDIGDGDGVVNKALSTNDDDQNMADDVEGKEEKDRKAFIDEIMVGDDNNVEEVIKEENNGQDGNDEIKECGQGLEKNVMSTVGDDNV